MSYELLRHTSGTKSRLGKPFPADRQRSAVSVRLHAVQHENQGLPDAEQMNAVAEYLELPSIQVYEVATFYSMFQTKRLGARSVDLHQRGVHAAWRRRPVDHVEQKLGIKLGESTDDGRSS